jgi:PKD repeat protein
MSPTADSSMKKGTQHLISWRDNISGGLHVDLYLNNVLVQVISAYATGTSLLWTVPTTLANGNKYQVKIYSGVTYDFSENFKILPADYIDYTGPGAFRMGETSNITWTDNISGPVKIDLLLADTLFRTLSGSTESDGSYAWTPPSDLPAETWYKIRISRVGAPALSDVSSPVPVYYTYYIDITSPEAGNFLLQGSEYAIQWNENFSNGESFRIDLFKNGDSIRQITAYNLPSYKLWQLNVLYADLPQGDDYTIRVKCNDKPAVFDFSSPFAIMNCDSLDFSIGRDTTMLTTGEIDLVAPDGYQFYFWTPVQNSGRIDHIPGSYFSPGNYQAICMAIHESGCIRKDTLILTVEYPPCLADANFFAENAEGTGICNTFTFRNTGMVPANCRMTWDFGDGTTMDTLSTAINHTFPGPGQYIVSCTVTDASIAGCSNSHIDTIVIQPPPDILLTHTFAADSGLFIASITGPGNYRIVWKIDSIPVDNMLNREGYQSDSLIWVFPDNGNYRIEMIVQDTISACTYSYVEDLVVSSIPPCHKTKGYFSTQPAFGYDTGDRSTFLFKGGVNELLPCSTYSFNLGDGTIITDTLQFVHRYASPGMYVATMTITDCAACSFTWKDTICAYSDFVSGLQPDVTGCDSTTLNATPGMSYYQWNDNTNNSFLKVTSNGQYWLLVADGLGYYLEDTTTVTIYPRTAVSLAPFPVICSNEGTYFLLGGQPFGGVYTGEFVSGEIFNVSASGPGFFEVRYHLPYLQGCSDTAYQIIEVEPISGAGTLYLQNIIQTDSAYFAGDSVLIGSTVTGSLPEGPYIVQSGAEVFVKAGNSLIMKPGTSINAGSHFMGVIMPLNCVTDSFVKALAETDAATMNTASKIMLGPNPTSGRTSLYISQGSFEGYHLHVFNSSGIRIMEQSNHTGKMINLDFEGLHEGLYFIRLWNENTAMTFKLVKN